MVMRKLDSIRVDIEKVYCEISRSNQAYYSQLRLVGMKESRYYYVEKNASEEELYYCLLPQRMQYLQLFEEFECQVDLVNF